jgi:Cu+-exporting ATPase
MEEEDIALQAVRTGDACCACVGRIPVDGGLLEGSSAVDESMITGEPHRSRKNGGSCCHAINQTGTFLMRAEKIRGGYLLSQIVKWWPMPNTALNQRMADQVCSGWFKSR